MSKTLIKPLTWSYDEASLRWVATTIVGPYYTWGINWRHGNGMVR